MTAFGLGFGACSVMVWMFLSGFWLGVHCQHRYEKWRQTQ